jgi:hypothetical protein
VELSPHLNYRSQVTDVETGQPDVVGTDPAGADQLVIEAKFWAGLTEKQPGGYVERLGVGKPGVVLVVAPAARLLTLWPELLANLAAYRANPYCPPTMSQAATSCCCHLAMSLPVRDRRGLGQDGRWGWALDRFDIPVRPLRVQCGRERCAQARPSDSSMTAWQRRILSAVTANEGNAVTRAR